jgi:CheY-like chemotaxis protein
MVKILLVDDMKNFLDLEISFLRRKDCQIITAADGFEALKYTKLEKPDIIILDHEMPKMTGIECARIIKNDDALKKIPIIMISSSNKQEEAFRAGVNEFVKKPLGEDSFLRELKKFIDIADREDTRMPLTLEVDYDFNGTKITAWTRDISKSGAFLISGDTFSVGSSVDLVIKLDEKKSVKVKGEVVREMREEEGGHLVTGMGFKFFKFTGDGRKALEGFLKKNG